jgi:4-alpha-glucanotransferase
MRRSTLHMLAEAAGVSAHWTDAFGQAQDVTTDSLRAILAALRLPADTEARCAESLAQVEALTRPAGLAPLLTVWAGEPVPVSATRLNEGDAYQVGLENGDAVHGHLRRGPSGALEIEPIQVPGYHAFTCKNVGTTLAVAPRQCFSVADAFRRAGLPATQKAWGLSAQLYSLRRPNDGGLADFTALGSLATAAATQGASALACSPVHAMFSAEPGRFSPYGPSSRLFFNVLHIDPARVFGADAFHAALAEVPQGAQRWAALESGRQVHWATAAPLRLAVLRRLFDSANLAIQPGNASSQAGAFADFCERGGQALQDHATFEALDASFQQEPIGLQGNCRQWPAEFHDPRSAQVHAFAQSHAPEIRFHQFLQWQADAGCAAVQASPRQAGMPIGIVADLAVGADPGGSQAWGLQSATLGGLSIGAPPDKLSTQGQSWGLGAFSPQALGAQGFAPWLAMLRANMRHAGGIRIDHILGLSRLWLVPDAQPASSGAYLRYPLDDLIRLTALESWRHGAIVIGEDLGTVPEGLSERLASAGLLGIRTLWFQRDGVTFLPPREWTPDAIATTSTHDLATVAGWWAGRDIDWRHRLHLYPPETAASQPDEERAIDRQALSAALQQAGFTDTSAAPASAPLDEVLAFVGSTPSPLVMVPLEDVLGIVEQPNLPGTVEIHPNWQQRLPQEATALLQQPGTVRRLEKLAQARSAASS